MNAIIIFPNDTGGVVFCYPTNEFPWDDIASQVPAGKPYKIVPDEFVPKDHTFFDAFEADFSTFDGIGVRI